MLKPELARLGYEGEFHKLPGKSTTIGVATFWHTRTFRLLKVDQNQIHARLWSTVLLPIQALRGL